ncbi:MAG: hypothetical protein ABIH72_02075 [archaeon]
MDSKNKVIVTFGILILLVLVFYFVAMNITKHTGYVSISEEETKKDFAQCLTNKGILMYGSAYCGHCKNQKELFGDSFLYVNYVECTENPEACQDLSGVPAWDINGEITYGTQTLEKLSELSGCSL